MLTKNLYHEKCDNDIEDKILVMTPELGIEVNVVHWMRVAVTGGYRWANGVSKSTGLNDSDFSNPVVSLTLRFGNFGYKKKE